jgi:hypothetical protein
VDFAVFERWLVNVKEIVVLRENADIGLLNQVFGFHWYQI